MTSDKETIYYWTRCGICNSQANATKLVEYERKEAQKEKLSDLYGRGIINSVQLEKELERLK